MTDERRARAGGLIGPRVLISLPCLLITDFLGVWSGVVTGGPCRPVVCGTRRVAG